MGGGLGFDGVEFGGRAWKGGSGRLVVPIGNLRGDAVGASQECAVVGGGSGSDPYSGLFVGELGLLGHRNHCSCRPLLLGHHLDVTSSAYVTPLFNAEMREPCPSIRSCLNENSRKTGPT